MVIRQRDRSDHDYPGFGRFPDTRAADDLAAVLGAHPKLVEEAHGGADEDIAEISRDEAEQITAGLAAWHWPPGAARLPWVLSVYPG